MFSRLRSLDFLEIEIMSNETKETKPRAKALSKIDFFTLHESCETLTEALQKSDMAEASYLQRVSKLRSEGWPLKSFPRRGGTSMTPDSVAEQIAAIKGITVEQVKAEAERLRAEAAERAAERAAANAEAEAPAQS